MLSSIPLYTGFYMFTQLLLSIKSKAMTEIFSKKKLFYRFKIFFFIFKKNRVSQKKLYFHRKNFNFHGKIFCFAQKKIKFHKYFFHKKNVHGF